MTFLPDRVLFGVSSGVAFVTFWPSDLRFLTRTEGVFGHVLLSEFRDIISNSDVNVVDLLDDFLAFEVAFLSSAFEDLGFWVAGDVFCLFDVSVERVAISSAERKK